ncbi:MAG: alpha-hydroxy acid oxidase [Phycisphaerae bacterium]|nr:alpha-hydroxy acid oxidase [Phycisphaerae bacterium]
MNEREPRSPQSMLNVFEFEEAAAKALDPLAWDYYRSGAWGEWTVKANRDAWERLRIWHRVMVDVSRRDTSRKLVGSTLPFPLLLAPTALHRLAHPEGEVATARAASALGVPMILSSLSSVAIEEVCQATTAPVWMQLYVSKDRDFTLSLAERARAAGCRAIVLTVDTPVWGTRERDVRNGWKLPAGVEVVNLIRPNQTGPSGHEGAGIGAALGWTIDASLSWRDLTWLVDRVRLPILVKGVCRGDDALRSLDCGARGVIVSNHGGRQLDGAPPTAESLPEVVRAIDRRVPVLVDGGIRRGTDILRAIALGADAVAIGRPVLWGLGAAGSAGVERVLQILKDEFDLAMALAGCRTLSEITRDLVR